MQFGLFVPTVVGTCLMGLMVALTSLLPETLNYSAGAAQSCDTTPPPKSSGTVRERVRQIPARVRDSTAFLWSDIRVAILVPTYLVHMLMYETNNLLVQYASARFNIAISRATLIIALQSALIIVQLLLILPAVTRFLTARLHTSPQRKDLLLARWSALLLSAGFLGVGLAPTLPLLVAAVPFEVAGWGFMFVTRSLITAFVEPHHVARLYTVLTLVDVAGLMLGAPAFAWLFDRGLEAGGAAAGLPFVVCSAMIAAAGALMLLIRVEDGPTAGAGRREGLLARPEESSGADPES
ncbi:Major facilitator superfamily domain general substrate transporter [Neofusicoccum parvum]|nr:Major facilitator superfamily domain general substrate transporter [Neofusicoccum parvum]